MKATTLWEQCEAQLDEAIDALRKCIAYLNAAKQNVKEAKECALEK